MNKYLCVFIFFFISVLIFLLIRSYSSYRCKVVEGYCCKAVTPAPPCNKIPPIKSDDLFKKIDISAYMKSGSDNNGIYICGLPTQYTDAQYAKCKDMTSVKKYNSEPKESLTPANKDIQPKHYSDDYLTPIYKNGDRMCVANLALSCGIIQGINQLLRNENPDTVARNVNWLKKNLMGMNYNLELISSENNSSDPKISRLYAPSYDESTDYPWNQQMDWDIGEDPKLWSGYTYAYGEEVGGEKTLNRYTKPYMYSKGNGIPIKDLYNNTTYSKDDQVYSNNGYKNNSIPSLPDKIPGYEIYVRELSDKKTVTSSSGEPYPTNPSGESLKYRLLRINNTTRDSIFLYYRTSGDSKFKDGLSKDPNWNFVTQQSNCKTNGSGCDDKSWAIALDGYVNGFVFATINPGKNLDIILPLCNTFDKNLDKTNTPFSLTSINISFYKNTPEVLCDWMSHSMEGTYTSNATLFEAGFEYHYNGTVEDFVDLSVIPGGSCGGHVNRYHPQTYQIGARSINTADKNGKCFNNNYAIDLSDPIKATVCGLNYKTKTCSGSSTAAQPCYNIEFIDNNKLKDNPGIINQLDNLTTNNECSIINGNFTIFPNIQYPPINSCGSSSSGGTPPTVYNGTEKGTLDDSCLDKFCPLSGICSWPTADQHCEPPSDNCNPYPSEPNGTDMDTCSDGKKCPKNGCCPKITSPCPNVEQCGEITSTNCPKVYEEACGGEYGPNTYYINGKGYSSTCPDPKNIPKGTFYYEFHNCPKSSNITESFINYNGQLNNNNSIEEFNYNILQNQYDWKL